MSIPRYVPGKPIEEVARELGLESIDKLASNECPTQPFPEVLKAVANAAATANRYPDNDTFELRRSLADFHDLDPTAIWVGSGSSDILRSTAMAVGGPGTSFVYADPSFVLYRMCALLTGSEGIGVSVRTDFGHDLDAMSDAIRDDTVLALVCNPNNPTGNHISADGLRAFLDSVPESVLVVVDEAYAEYVTAPDYESMLQLAPDRANLLVLRTFSKIYGLAGMRVGYAAGNPEALSALKRTQAPFAVSSVAQAAAIEALKHQSAVRERAVVNAYGRGALVDALAERGYKPAPTQSNFVYFEPERGARALGDALLAEGTIVRVLGDGVRVTVGTDAENDRFISALDAVEAG